MDEEKKRARGTQLSWINIWEDKKACLLLAKTLKFRPPLPKNPLLHVCRSPHATPPLSSPLPIAPCGRFPRNTYRRLFLPKVIARHRRRGPPIAQPISLVGKSETHSSQGHEHTEPLEHGRTYPARRLGARAPQENAKTRKRKTRKTKKAR